MQIGGGVGCARYSQVHVEELTDSVGGIPADLRSRIDDMTNLSV